MTTKEKAHPNAGTLEQAETGTNFAGHIPDSDSITNKSRSRWLIYDRLRVGPENGKGLRELTSEMGVNERTVRQMIHRERKAGKLILSDNQHGYFRPASEHEIRRFIGSMSHRSKEIAAVSKAAEDALAKMNGQGQIRGW